MDKGAREVCAKKTWSTKDAIAERVTAIRQKLLIRKREGDREKDVVRVDVLIEP